MIPSFCICIVLAHFYYKFRTADGVQTVLSALRPAVVALIASAGASILTLALFNTEWYNIRIGDIRLPELLIFAASLYLLRKFKVSAVMIILGSGVIGAVLCLIK